MQIEVNGTRLWFDVDGAAPDRYLQVLEDFVTGVSGPSDQ